MRLCGRGIHKRLKRSKRLIARKGNLRASALALREKNFGGETGEKDKSRAAI
jgi:hypothetical protein